MLPESALANMYPLIATPSHDGKYFHNYVLSLLNIVHTSASQGLRVQVLMQRGESLVTRARNNCVADFLANKDWTHLFWIDSDIGFSAQAFHRLLLADRDVVAGVYPLKRENWPAEGLPQGMTQTEFENTYTAYTTNANAKQGETLVLDVDADGFMKVDYAPTGFMVIKRAVFEKMMQAYPELQYVPDGFGDKDEGFHYRFFDCMVEPTTKRYLSEDYTFCHLWQQIGGEIYVDACSNLTHQGAKVYQGSFADSLASNLPFAVFAPAGTKMELRTQTSLVPNDKGAV